MNAIELLKSNRGTVYTTEEIAEALWLDRDAVQRELEAAFCDGELEHSQRDRDDADQWVMPLLNTAPATSIAADTLPTLQQIKQALKTCQTFDSVRIANGAVIARVGYYYRHGLSCETLREAALHALKFAAISERTVAIEVTDHWHAWPHDSFFKIEVFIQMKTPVEPAAAPAAEPAALTELKQQALSFEDRTKQVYPSCRFAALNIYGPRADWCVWGDFASSEEADRVAVQWMTVFHAPLAAQEPNGNYIRVSVNI